MAVAIVNYRHDIAAGSFGRNVKVTAYAHCGTLGADIRRNCHIEIIGVGELNFDTGCL